MKGVEGGGGGVSGAYMADDSCLSACSLDVPTHESRFQQRIDIYIVAFQHEMHCYHETNYACP